MLDFGPGAASRYSAPVPGEAVLEIADAVRAFGARRALDGLSLTLGAGEIYALLGPNGAGKTSLIRAISGRLRLDAGSVRLLGRDPREREARRQLGLVPQEIALYPDLTLRENLEVLGRLAGVPAKQIRTRVEGALRATLLESRAQSRAGQLSGGMQRRANLAAGMLHEPRVLLLDEPTVGIDPPSRERVHALLRELRSRGTALLLTTHDLDQAAELADRVGILVDGQIRAEGTTPDLVRDVLGGARELRVTLAAEPAQAARAALAQEGLAPSADARAWSGPLAGDMAALAALGHRLAHAQVGVAEIRLREPDLRSVFFRVAGRELDA